MKVTQLWPALHDPMYSSLPDSSVHDILQARILEWVALLLPAELSGKPEDTGAGSLSLLQQTFPTQEFNQCLLHCWQILYQLSSLAGARPNPHLIFAFVQFRLPGSLPVLLLLCCLCDGFCLGCKICLFSLPRCQIGGFSGNIDVSL